jgi:putative transposase
MQEHVHLLLTEPKKKNLSIVLQVLKQSASRALLKRSENSNYCKEDHFWLRRFYDFNVWSGKKLTEKLNYMHLNPIKRNLVIHLRDWPWSSWSHYANGETGLIGIDRWDEPIGEIENPHP